MRLLLPLLLVPSLGSAVEFADYDFGRWSREVTECDRLAAHGRDPGSIAPHVGSARISEIAYIGTDLQQFAQTFEGFSIASSIWTSQADSPNKTFKLKLNLDDESLPEKESQEK